MVPFSPPTPPNPLVGEGPQKDPMNQFGSMKNKRIKKFIRNKTKILRDASVPGVGTQVSGGGTQASGVIGR